MAQRFRVNSPGVIDQSVDGEVLIVNLETGFYYSSDGSGDAMWALLARGATVEEAAEALAAAYDAPAGDLLQATEAFLSQLIQEDLVTADGAAAPGAAPSLQPRGAFTPPVLQKYTDMQELLLLDPIHDVDATGWPQARPGMVPGTDR
jgi:hypothetical protein